MMLQAIHMSDTPRVLMGRRKESQSTTPILVPVDTGVKRRFDVFCAERQISKSKLIEALLVTVMADPSLLERAAQVAESALDKDGD